MKTIILVILAALTLSACEPVPRNAEECVLANMTGVESDRAATVIYGACQDSFPAPPKKPNVYEQFDH